MEPSLFRSSSPSRCIALVSEELLIAVLESSPDPVQPSSLPWIFRHQWRLDTLAGRTLGANWPVNYFFIILIDIQIRDRRCCRRDIRLGINMESNRFRDVWKQHWELLRI